MAECAECPSVAKLPGPGGSPSLRQRRSLDQPFLSLTSVDRSASRGAGPRREASQGPWPSGECLPVDTQGGKPRLGFGPRVAVKGLRWRLTWPVAAWLVGDRTLGDCKGLLSSSVSLHSQVRGGFRGGHRAPLGDVKAWPPGPASGCVGVASRSLSCVPPWPVRSR